MEPVDDGWCCCSHRSRWAQFQYDCQPSEENASGCKQENYGACLLSYTGLMGEDCTAVGGLVGGGEGWGGGGHGLGPQNTESELGRRLEQKI